MAKNEKAWGIGFKRLIGDESLGEAWGIAIENTNKQLHILDIDDSELDWALSADSYPSVYIHGSASASEYIKMYTDSTDGHIDVVGANLSLDVAGVPEISITAGNLDLGTNTLWATNLVINSTNAMTVQIGSTDALAIDDAAITLAAATGVAGQDIYIKAEDGGLGSVTVGGTGAHLYINAGNAGTSLTGTGGAGGNIYLTAGTASAGSGASAGGKGGNIILTPGGFGSIGTGTQGLVQVMGTASWPASSAGTITMAIGAPTAVGSCTIAEWLLIQNEAGSDRYIPAFAVGV